MVCVAILGIHVGPKPQYKLRNMVIHVAYLFILTLFYAQDKSKEEMKGKTEKSDTDKKRERRKKKTEKRKKRKEKEQRQKLVEKLNPGLGNKYSKEKAMRELEKTSKGGKSVTVLKVRFLGD